MQENRMRRVLVKVGGETLQDPLDRARLAQDLAGVRDQGVQLCVVHGAGPQITALGQRLGVQSTFRGGRRVTDAAMLEAVAMAMAGQVGPLLLAACRGCQRFRPPRRQVVACWAGSGRRDRCRVRPSSSTLGWSRT
jgi:acetylglutamate kinase